MLAFRLKKKRYQIQAPLTSLIDIVFLLLIYFLLTSSFIGEEGIKINLPNAKGSAPQTKKEITITIDKKGDSYIMGQKVPMHKLNAYLEEIIGNNNSKLVVVKADKNTLVNDVVMVMDIAKASGAKRLCLATEKNY